MVMQLAVVAGKADPHFSMLILDTWRLEGYRQSPLDAF